MIDILRADLTSLLKSYSKSTLKNCYYKRYTFFVFFLKREKKTHRIDFFRDLPLAFIVGQGNTAKCLLNALCKVTEDYVTLCKIMQAKGVMKLSSFLWACR